MFRATGLKKLHSVDENKDYFVGCKKNGLDCVDWPISILNDRKEVYQCTSVGVRKFM